MSLRSYYNFHRWKNEFNRHWGTGIYYKVLLPHKMLSNSTFRITYLVRSFGFSIFTRWPSISSRICYESSRKQRVIILNFAQIYLRSAGLLWIPLILWRRTAVALRGNDGVVFAVEKLVTSKLYESGATKRIFNIDTHIGMVSLFLKIPIDKFISVN